MTPERFGALAEAYGGDIGRWPLAERESAERWRAAHPEKAEAALDRATALDALLDTAPALRATGALAERIAAAAPQVQRPQRPNWWLPAGMGAGLAAACAAGVVVGMQVSQSQVSEGDAVVAAVSEGLGLYVDDGA